MVDFSFIVPVYNAEKTISACLDSICAQTSTDFEVLVIDDGSTDNSLNICDKYHYRDNRVTVFHQKNRGPSSARNLGLDHARGDWICFVDSDDRISLDYLGQITSVLKDKEADVIFIGYYKECDSNQIESVIPMITMKTKLDIAVELSSQEMFGYTWIKCFKRDIIGAIRFEEGIDLFEDEIFACRVLQECKNVSLVPCPIYYYAVNGQDNLMGAAHEDFCLLRDKVFKAWMELLEQHPDKDSILEQKANAFVSQCYYYGFERGVDLESFFKDLKKTLFFQKHTALNRLDQYVKQEKFNRLRMAKRKYLTKMNLYKAFK